jgi:hypothetical protein
LRGLRAPRVALLLLLALTGLAPAQDSLSRERERAAVRGATARLALAEPALARPAPARPAPPAPSQGQDDAAGAPPAPDAAGGVGLPFARLDPACGDRWRLLREGRAWFLATPCGERFFSTGVNIVDAVVPRKSLPRGHVGYDWRRLGYGGFEAWLDETRARLRRWGFNTAGGWSLPPAELDMPAVINLELGRNARFHWFDPFDPATETLMAQKAVELTRGYRGDPRRIGYFSDNEVGWWGGALFVFFSEKPATSFTKRRWVGMLEAHYRGDFAAFARDFVPPPGVASWAALAAAERPTHLREGGRGIEAVGKWTGLVAEHYYQMVARTLRAADPGALYFGDRLPIYYDPAALAAMARHVDVMAINYNPDSGDGWVAPYFFDAARAITAGKPILVSEWFFAADENRTGNRNNGHLMTVATQAERAAGAAAVTRNLAAIPEIVGMHWFQWADHPKGGRGDGEDYNFGLVDVQGQPYRRLTASLAAANRAAPSIHARARPGIGGRDWRIPHARVRLGDATLAEWPKPAALLPEMTPEAGAAVFGEAYAAWDEEGLHLATIGQDYYDIALFGAGAGPFPIGEAYRLELELAGRRFTLAFIPPRVKLKDHPPMAALLCAGRPPSEADCVPVAGAAAGYFGADQPRVTAELFLPWSALGMKAPPAHLPLALTQTSWHRARTMRLAGTLVLEKGVPAASSGGK